MGSSDSPFVEARLPNGLRIVTEVMPTVRSAAAGFLVHAGSRDEPAALAGVSHFLEHMCFKGTHRRDWREISIAFDEIGSYYNAFTGKEQTFYYGWVPADRIDDQIELLADMMRPVLPPEEFDVEKGVILEEIAMSKDSIESQAWDLIHEWFYPGHPLGWPVLGTAESIEALTRDQMGEYFQQRYSPSNVVLIATGRVDPQRIIATAERLCGDWTPVELDARREPPKVQGGSVVRQVERFNQQAIGWTFPAPPEGHPDTEVALAVSSVLGGENSRFYWDIVQAGLSPNAGVYWFGRNDCGMIMLDGLCLPDKAEAFEEAVRREAEKITREGVTEAELQRVKNRRRTSLVAEAEAAFRRLLQVAEDLCGYDHPRTVEERLAEVESVTAERVARYLSDWPIVDGGLFLSLGPRQWPEVQAP